MLVLASKSPRREQLLRLGGWVFVIRAADVDESVRPGEPPDSYVRRLAELKAKAALELLSTAERGTALILAADTAVVDTPQGNVAAQILGKPADAFEAEAMLRRLRGRAHQVYTGLAVLRAVDHHCETDVALTMVHMRAYSDAEMTAYIEEGDPLDKAGAYGIQHPGFHPVERLSGCFPNVMGLPLCRVSRLLEKAGMPAPVEIFAECAVDGSEPCLVSRLARPLSAG